jgi:predicted DNA-binding transcriptional regulator YafY
VKENITPKKSNPNVCVVWDVNQAAWRSFRWDRVKKVQFDIG